MVPEILLSPVARRAIGREARRSADGRETGGILLGFDASGQRSAVITVAAGPGPRSVRRTYRFRRDPEYSQEIADEAYSLDGSVWVGEWHTHPAGGNEPSGVDLHSYRKVLGTGALPALLAIIVVPGPWRGWLAPRLAPWIVEDDGYEPARFVA